MATAEELIAFLKLQPHPREGGFFRETYRSTEIIAPGGMPAHYPSGRAQGTAIYYLLTARSFSALHRLASDEIFHFYLGDPVCMLQLHADGKGQTIVLGPDVMAGQRVQVVVPRGVWQGSILEPGGQFALLGCTVAPGFEYADYEEAKRHELHRSHPQFADLITKLTPAPSKRGQDP